MLVFVALLPAILLMRFIYKLDKIEKEPMHLLIKVFIFGVVSVIPVFIAEMLFEIPLVMFFDEGTYAYIVVENFIGIALIEEYFKYWAVKKGAWKSPEFNYRFDGIVYGAFSALGFAAIENIMYVLDEGLEVGIMRALVSVPSHAIDGITMGYFLGLARAAENQGNEKAKKKYIRLGILIPTIEHGLYDGALDLGTDMAMLFWLIFVVIIDIWAIVFVKKAAKKDEMI